MCLIAFSWNTHPQWRLVVAANRDEWRDRPAAPANWWHDNRQILAGRDLKANGTWLGITRGGRFAALTNFRDPADRKSDAPTRGALVSDFLAGTMTAEDYLSRLVIDAHRYQGFNLIAGDVRDRLFCFGSREGRFAAISPGVHALSNHMLNEPWPKVSSAKLALEAALQAEMSGESHISSIYAILSNEDRAPDQALPDTGVGLEWERVLSPALIVTPRYGTRCSTLLTVTRDGQAYFEERTRGDDGAVTGRVAYRFSIEAGGDSTV